MIAAIVMLSTAPSVGQVVSPTLYPPPCSGNHCFSHARGAITPHVQGPSAQKRGCPQGTVYDPVKGTCKVVRLMTP
jgi:hypothetical protein